MTLRIAASTAATGTSATWQPAGTADIVIQIGNDADMNELVVELQAQVSGAAPFASVCAWRPGSEPFMKAPHFFAVRLFWRGNKGNLNAWDAE